jgi:hypothetical protein
MRMVAVNILNKHKQSRTADEGWLYSSEILGGELTCPNHKDHHVMKHCTDPRNWTVSLEQPGACRTHGVDEDCT